MAPRKPKPPTADLKTPVHSGRVTKDRSDTNKRTESARTPAAPSKKACRVKRYKNGILNLEKTPPHLVDTVRRNATKSPLLRLPPEIRNQIWYFTMGGQLIAFPNRNHAKGCAVMCETRADAGFCCPRSHSNYIYPTMRLQVEAAFHLPEVCRQIYAETALTAYQQNTFIFKAGSMACLTAAQRRAITKVQINIGRLHCHMEHDFLQRWNPITHLLPNASCILVTGSALGYLKRHRACFEGTSGREDQVTMQAWVSQNLRNIYGDKMKVVFEEGIRKDLYI
ncbi:hypothetical protein OPT61_g6314 [Boeremia exigua]|uniref:Uncharacterized protein n=1 Tax=Boeremia exigua TaxID=749465 RepID=A0ACC2I706_9PLEO|nr:hypothetical protein OPT61_g6314 [Boeremia exigua]